MKNSPAFIRNAGEFLFLFAQIPHAQRQAAAALVIGHTVTALTVILAVHVGAGTGMDIAAAICAALFTRHRAHLI